MINNSGRLGKRAVDGLGILNQADKFNQAAYTIPKVDSYAITDGSYNPINDTAVDTAGSQTIVLYGSGFKSGATVMVGSTSIAVVTVLGNDRITFSSPALASGSYTVYVTNNDGGTGILVPGLVYSGLPTWSTSAGSLGSYYETTSLDSTLTATGDAPITYSLYSGSLPSGATLFSNGAIVGSSPVESASTTYSFSVQATDAENQDSYRSFSITVNTDVVTWSNPSANVSYDLSQDTLMSNVTLTASSAAGYAVSYSANALPSGVSLANGVVYGTPTVLGSNVSLITATAATTNRSSVRLVTWVISVAGDQYLKYTSLLLSANSGIVTSSFVSDASLNNAQLTVVADTRASAFNPYQFGYYSLYLNGSAGVSVTTASSNFTIPTSTTPFTLECWVHPTTTGTLYSAISTSGTTYQYTLSFGSSVGTYDATAKPWFGVYNGSWNGIISSTAISANRWTHIAAVFTGSTSYIFQNGVQTASGGPTTWPVTGSTDVVKLGIRNDAANYYTGYISNARVVIGTAVYTSAFTPSTTPLSAVANTKLLLAQSNSIVDRSINNAALTITGSPTVIAANPFPTVYQAGTQYYSNYFDGTGDYLTVSSTANAAFGFGTGDFTIEGWFYATVDNATDFMIDFRGSVATAPAIFVYTSNQLALYYNGSIVYQPSSLTFTIKQWNHVALVRSSNVTKFYLNGTGAATTYTDNNNYPSAACIIGTDAVAGGSSYWTGYISNVRVTKGQALYTTTFTPSTTPLTTTSQGASANNVSLLTCQDNKFIDNSTNAFAITASGDTKPLAQSPFTPSAYSSTAVTTWGSGYFDGTGDYLTLASSGGLIIGQNTATIEFWIYPTSVSSYQRLVTTTAGAFTSADFVIRFNNGTFLAGHATNNINSSTLPAINQWNHVAWVGVGGTTQTLYINGVNAGSTTTYNITAAILFIGGYYTTGPAEFANGYMTDVRVVKGTALYTSNFVPQFTTPLTAITNTQLLTLQNYGAHNNSDFVDYSGSNNIVTRSGNATNGTFGPYGDNFSVYNSANSTGLVAAYNASMVIGTNQFTIEAWIYPSATLSTQQTIFSNRTFNSTGTGTFTFYVAATTNYLKFDEVQAATNITTSTTAVVPNTWQHVALTRDSSNSVRIFINGTLANTPVTSSFNFSSTNNFQIGYNADTNYYSFIGYISNLRLLVGTALYTSAFTAPTSPLTAITNTKLLTCQSNRFIDNSVVNSTITLQGSPQVQKFSPFATVTVPTYYSGYFDGTGDYLTVPAQTALSFSTGDFTIECWAFYTALNADQGIIDCRSTGGALQSWILNVKTGGVVDFIYSGSARLQTSGLFSTGAWTHIAVTRASGTIRIFVNGVQGASVSYASAIDSNATAPNIGRGIDPVYTTGYISNLRIVKGQALYTTTFTPSTTPLTTTSQGATASNVSLLTCQTNTFIDNSTNYFAITAAGDAKPRPVSPFTPTANSTTNYTPTLFGGSMYFDGSGDYISTTTTAPFGASNYTIECWIYHIVSPNPCWIWDGLFNSGTGPQIFVTSSGTSLNFYKNSATSIIAATVATKLYSWTHYAFCRVGTTVTAYVNGVSVGTGTDDTTSNTTIRGGFGSRARDGAEPNQAYFSDFRILTGVALYTANFYPGATPVTPTATIGTTTYKSVLLLNGTSAGVIDTSRTSYLETLGDAKVTPFSPYAGSYYSNYFATTSDYISAPIASFPYSGTTWTIEGWFNVSTVAGTVGFFCSPDLLECKYSGTTFTVIYRNNPSSATWTTLSGTVTLSTSTWYHIAISVSAGSMRLFINGVQYGSTTAVAAGAYGGTGTNAVLIGANDAYTFGSIDSTLAGYVSNFRITNTAVYTGNFTPSTSPLTAISGTSLLTCQSNKFVDNSSNALTITRSGTPKVQTQNPFQTNTGISYYFDGTGDYVLSTGSTAFTFGTGDFTVEYWVYHTAVAATYNQHVGVSTTSAGFAFGTNASLQLYMTTSTVGYTSTGTSFVLNRWHHVAYCRVNGVVNYYLDGAFNYSPGTVSTNITETGMYIGASSGGTYPMTGYIADLRVTKGYARYTSAFSVPTSPVLTK